MSFWSVKHDRVVERHREIKRSIHNPIRNCANDRAVVTQLYSHGGSCLLRRARADQSEHTRFLDGRPLRDRVFDTEGE